MEICKFCLENKKLVNSHIVPRAFFEEIKVKKEDNGRSQKLKEITNDKERYPFGSTVTGLYDPNLVCFDCEQIFGPADDYAIKLLLKNQEEFIPKYINSSLVAWKVEKYDYEKLMLFFISLLWRAACSGLPQFGKIKIGPWLEKAKQAVSTKSIDHIEQFSVFLARFDEGYGRKIIMDPYLCRLEHINTCHFYLGAGYDFYIKVDKRPFTSDFENLKLSEENFFILNRGKFEHSNDLLVVQKIYRDAEQLATNWRSNKD